MEEREREGALEFCVRVCLYVRTGSPIPLTTKPRLEIVEQPKSVRLPLCACVSLYHR